MSRILVVEDDADIGQLIAHYLQKAGHTTECLTSGSGVVPHARAAPPDLVILDLMLPGMDGLMVCQALRAQRETAGSAANHSLARRPKSGVSPFAERANGAR